ncbi:hypothetical protein KRX57_01515 [Weeksellaceae bacterium TAE3-ERU29]|nr:hypothetical protein [Weeksellaceae bacterium TAE3-ERU29]
MTIYPTTAESRNRQQKFKMKKLKFTLFLLLILQVVNSQSKSIKDSLYKELTSEYFEISGLKDYYFNKLYNFSKEVTVNKKQEIDTTALKSTVDNIIKSESTKLLSELQKTISKEYSISEFYMLLEVLKSPMMMKYMKIKNKFMILNYQYGHYINEDKLINKLVDKKILDESFRRNQVAPPMIDEK